MTHPNPTPDPTPHKELDMAAPTDDRTMSLRIFPGAARAQGYAENPVMAPPQPVGPPPVAPVEPPREQGRHGARGRGSTPVPATPPVLWGPPTAPVTAPVAPARADWGWRGRITRTGLLKLAPSTVELTHRQAIATITTATWTRSVNIVVTNPKGGVGKTPTTLIVAGILAQLRGGSVAALEAAEAAGTLTSRAEGAPVRGLGELVEATGSIHTAGNLAGYAAPQSSHAHVFGTVGARRPLAGDDVLNVRRVLDTYYRITLADTGNNPAHNAYLASLHTADAVIIPCLPTIDALGGLEQTLATVFGAAGLAGGHHGLLSRLVIVLGHDGGPENPKIADRVRARLEELPFPVVEVPYDPTIRDGGPVVIGALSEESLRAWTSVAAAVVTALGAARTDIDLVAAATPPRRTTTAPTPR